MTKITAATILDNNKTFEVTATHRRNKNKAPATFKEVFGDLSNCVFYGGFNLHDLNLSSLKGCPAKIHSGDFLLLKNPNLKNLDHFPQLGKLVEAFTIDSTQLHLLEDLDINLYSNVKNIGYANYFDDNEPSELEIVKYFSNIRKVKGFFPIFETTPIDLDKAEKLFKIYEKLDFDSAKLDRVEDLL